jgi:kumamolisin
VWTGLAAASAGSLLVASLAAAASADASATPGQSAGTGPAEVAVAQGISMAGMDAKPVFSASPNTKETVSFVLRMRSESALEARVDAGIKRNFMSVGQFAADYGQYPAKIRALQDYLSRYGLTSTAYADGLDVTATGTAREFNHALHVTQDVYTTAAVPARGGQAAQSAVTFHATKDKPLLPEAIGSYVESILGLDNYPLFASDAMHTPWTPPAKAALGFQDGDRTPADFARTYGLDPLYAKGAEGQGQTIGIVTFATLASGAVSHFWNDTLRIATKPDRITLDNVDGGSGPVSTARGSDETTLDVEQSGALAPQANIVVYQAPNCDYGGIDAYATAASQNVAGTVSTSWGESETLLAAAAASGQESPTEIQAYDEFFLELAAQGQGEFTATGDSGAYAAYLDQGTTNVSVQNTADSPWTTAAGGTTLPGIIPIYNEVGTSPEQVNVRIVRERAWGWDYKWPYYALFPANSGAPFTSESAFAITQIAGDGGGYSSVEARPGYQKVIPNIGDYSAVPYLTPATFADMSGTDLSEPTTWNVWDALTLSTAPPAVITGTASGRALPDISADADPATGYDLYYGGSDQSGWGGTSFVAPQLNGSAAVIDSYLGHRVGFWNPAIYRFAVGHSSPFKPLDTSGGSNDNLYYTGTKGALFNPATGLGTPNLAKLAADFLAGGW